MDANGNNQQAQDTQGQQPAPPQEQQDKLLTYTQAQMTALMSKEKHEGKDSVYRALGIDTRNKDAIEQARAALAQQAAPPPASVKQEQAQQPVTQEAQPQQPQVNAVVRAEAKVALLGAGVQPNLLDDALTLVLHKVDKVETIQAEVDALKAKHTVLFTQATQTTGQLVGGVGAGAAQPTTAAEFGKQLAQAKNAHKATQQQFFGGNSK